MQDLARARGGAVQQASARQDKGCCETRGGVRWIGAEGVETYGRTAGSETRTGGRTERRWDGGGGRPTVVGDGGSDRIRVPETRAELPVVVASSRAMGTLAELARRNGNGWSRSWMLRIFERVGGSFRLRRTGLASGTLTERAAGAADVEGDVGRSATADGRGLSNARPVRRVGDGRTSGRAGETSPTPPPPAAAPPHRVGRQVLRTNPSFMKM